MEENPIGKQIALIRKENNLTQQTLADSTGLNRRSLANIEQGQSEPSITVLKKIAEALGCELVLKIVPKNLK